MYHCFHEKKTPYTSNLHHSKKKMRTCLYTIGSFLYPVRYSQSHYNGQTNNCEVSSGGEIDVLKIRQDHPNEHPKHDDERPTQHGVGDGNEDSRKFTHQAKGDVDYSTQHKHLSAANLYNTYTR